LDQQIGRFRQSLFAQSRRQRGLDLFFADFVGGAVNGGGALVGRRRPVDAVLFRQLFQPFRGQDRVFAQRGGGGGGGLVGRGVQSGKQIAQADVFAGNLGLLL